MGAPFLGFWGTLLIAAAAVVCAGILIVLALREVVRAIIVGSGGRTSTERAGGKDALHLVPWVDGPGHSGSDSYDGGGFDGGGCGGD